MLKDRVSPKYHIPSSKLTLKLITKSYVDRVLK
jgi:hypothetical protein